MIEGSVARSPRDVTPPNLPYGHAPRPRLVAMIERPFRARVTLIVAGAGSGKTILATEWAAQCDAPVAWLTLSTDDNDPHTLIDDLRTALRPCLRRGRTAHPQETDDERRLLEDDVGNVLPGNCVVIDNGECITSPEAFQIVSDVVAALPEGCSVVLASRRPPPIPLGKLRASGHAREIGDAHLRFTRPETTAFFAGLPDVHLEPDEAQQVHHFTQGWAVGLYLVSLASRAHTHTLLPSDERHPVFHQFVDEYVRQEILAPLSPASRAFLMATIELPAVSAEVCRQALDIDDATGRMATLVGEFPFITPVAGASDRWTWPHMIRESLLRITGATQGRHAEASPHQRVAAVLLRDEAIREAADFALIGGDPTWIAATIRPWCEHLALRSDFEPLSALMERLPDDVVATHPDFAYWRAIAHLGIARHLSVAEWFPPVERQWLDSGDALLRGRALVCRSIIAWLSMLHAESIAAADAALSILPPSAVTERMYATTTKARVLFREGDDAAAAIAIRHAEQLAAQLPMDEQWAWRALAMDRADAYAQRGDLRSAITKYRLIISELPESLRFLEGFYRCRLVSLAIEQDALESARGEYAHAERLLEGEWRQWHLWAIVARTRLLIAEGRMKEAEAWATSHVKAMRRMPGKSQLVMQLARVWLHHGEHAMVRSWLGDLDDLPFPWIDAFGEVAHPMLQIDLDLAEGQYAAAAERAEALSRRAEAMNRCPEWIALDIRWALARSLLGDAERAIAMLAEVVTRGDRGGFVASYRVPGFDTAPLIDEARRLNASRAQQAPPARNAPAPVLTPREREVLRLVERGRSNQQIAEELFISANTVRNHLVHICRRLDANSRVEAVARARDLGLLR